MITWILLKNERHSNIPINSIIFKIKALDLEKPLRLMTSKSVRDGWEDGKNVPVLASK